MTTFLNPTPRDSDGLLDGYTDILGGEPLEETVRTVIVSSAEGTIVVQEVDGGGNVTWVRGIWDIGTQFRYDSYMAPTTDPSAVNYLDGGSAVNEYNGTTYYTTITPGTPISNNTQYIVYYTRRSGVLTTKGDPISGWPYMHVDPVYQGTAEDGDLYVLWALNVADAAFNQTRFSNLASRIAQAQLAGSRPQGNEIRFDLPLEAEAGSTGLYEYYNEASPPTTTCLGVISGTTLTVTEAYGEIGVNHILTGVGVSADTYITEYLTGKGGAGTYTVNNSHTSTGLITITATQFTGTPFSWNVVAKGGGLDGNCLLVETSVISGGPPYNYSGWGCWQTWATSIDEPFTSIDFKFDGAGCGRNIELSTNAQDDAPGADVVYLIPCLSSLAGVFTSYSITKDDFWRVNNVPWDYQHKEAYYNGTSGTYSTHSLTNEEYGTAIAPRFDFDFSLTPVPTGPELVVNGDFASGLTGWTDSSSGGGTVTVSGGVATLTYGTGRARMRQGVTVEVGKTYLIQFTTSNFVASEPCIDIGTAAGSAAYVSDYTCGNGLQQISVTATNTSLWLNFFSQTLGRSYSFDNVSIKEAQPAGTALCYFGVDSAVCNSTGTTTLNISIKPTVTGTATLTITDGVGNKSTTLSLTANTRVTHTIPWTTFGTVTHPVTQIKIEPIDTGTGSYWMLGAYFDSIVRMSDIPGGITAIGGFEFQFPSYDIGGDAYACRFSDVILNVNIQDGPVSDKTRYVGIPRWTYKWTKVNDWIGYGMWRGWSGAGYLWLAGWTNSGVVNPDNGKTMAANIRNFMQDAQDEYIARFPAENTNNSVIIPGPFMPRYGRPSWEALNQEGVIGNPATFTSNTYNKWYFAWDDTLPESGQEYADDWYGYTCRAILSCASDYYREPTVQIKAILDKWIAWFNAGERTETDAFTWSSSPAPSKIGTYTVGGDPVFGIIWDEDHWHPPSAYLANGKVRYHYNPIYSYACIAEAMLFKYWTDGDADALKWLRRLMLYLRSQQLSDTGYLAIAMRGSEGSGYTTATVEIEGDGTGAAITPHIFGGKVRYYTIDNAGADYTYISGTVVGDGEGATVVLALADYLVGAFDTYHTGWELWEIYNLLAMLVYGSEPGGTVNYPLENNPQDVLSLTLLEAFVRRNTTDSFPMVMLANGLPIHEYGGLDPYHNGSGIDNPMSRDTHARGAMWTETTGPAFRASVYRQLIFGDTI